MPKLELYIYMYSYVYVYICVCVCVCVWCVYVYIQCIHKHMLYRVKDEIIHTPGKFGLKLSFIQWRSVDLDHGPSIGPHVAIRY